ncbi:MAG: EF-hand domain-containing protein [Roseimicrobium sp.]
MKTSFVLCALLLGACITHGLATPAPVTPPAPGPATPSSPSTTPATPESDVAKTKAKKGKLFSKLDANNDAYVDREEFKKARFAKKNETRAEKRFGRADKNGDGKLTKDEWLAAPVRGKKGKTVS